MTVSPTARRARGTKDHHCTLDRQPLQRHELALCLAGTVSSGCTPICLAERSPHSTLSFCCTPLYL